MLAIWWIQHMRLVDVLDVIEVGCPLLSQLKEPNASLLTGEYLPATGRKTVEIQDREQRRAQR